MAEWRVCSYSASCEWSFSFDELWWIFEPCGGVLWYGAFCDYCYFIHHTGVSVRRAVGIIFVLLYL